MTLQFGVGIECTFIVHERAGMRRLEEFELMHHYEMWRSDLELVAKLRSGERRVTHLRWCFPWYRVEAQKGKFDFSWSDEVVAYAAELGIELIPDIVHYGTPNWLEDAYFNADYPQHVAEFAAACAQRYKGQIKYYTPFNEPGIGCMFSCERGEWPPYQKSEEAYVRAMVQIAEGVKQTTRAIKQVDSNAECWAVEAMNNYRKATNAGAAAEARRRLLRDLACWDLVHGKVHDQHDTHKWLTSNGISPKRVQQFLEQPIAMEVLGLNFYPWQSKTITADASGGVTDEFELSGALLYDLLKDSFEHTGAKRLWVTETSAHGSGGAKSSAVLPVKEPDRRAAWLDGTLKAVEKARAERIPVEGYIQFPLFSMVDWAYRHDSDSTTTPEDYYINLGMIEVDPKTHERKWTPVADRFLEHLGSAVGARRT